jgi:hypothetical protein
MKMRFLCTLLGIGAIAIAWTACYTQSAMIAMTIPKGARIIPCTVDGDCQMLPKRPFCASQQYSMCVNGGCAFVPRPPSETPNARCDCYRGQVAECMMSGTKCGLTSGVATCNVTDDYHSAWNTGCANLAKDGGPD